MSTLTERLFSLVNLKVDSRRPYKNMQELTGIASDRWSAVFSERQRPTVEMIEAVAKIWPQHAFWLATGIEDSIAGHTNPEIRDSKHWGAEYVAEEIFQWKLSRKYHPEKLFGFMRKPVNGANLKEWKSFADLFDEKGYVSRLNISMKLLAWLTKEEDTRPEYEREILRLLYMQEAPGEARSEETFFNWESNETSPKVQLKEPYLTQLLKLKELTSEKSLRAASPTNQSKK